ncbi:MAG TPA: ABC transporter permease, partial [Longimicrobiaceae bacterium]|nr:ABC transporter permease [Longimicrobiaceae bacterium]
MKADRFAGIRRVFRIRNVDRDLDDELAFHFQQTVEELMQKGMSPQQAKEEAHRRFGDLHHYRAEMEELDRRAEVGRRWEMGWQDVRYAFRRMRRSPGLTAAVILTFALGVGANATMFGIIDRLLLRPPAHVQEPGEVKHLVVDRYVSFLGTRSTGDVLSYPDYEGFTRGRAFSSVAGFWNRDLTLGRGESARPVKGTLVTGNFFSTLGTSPAVGRFFGPAEDEKGAPATAVISQGLWQREFGGDPAVVGRTLDLGHAEPYTIVGIAPQGFTGVDLKPVDVWIPLHTALALMGQEFWLESAGSYFIRAVGRLAPGVSPAQAAAEATVLHRQVRAEQIAAGDYDPEAEVIAASLIAGRGPLAPDEARVARWLAAISLIVLLIAGANVANLLLARAVRQRGEIAIRLALGSSRGRVLRQVLMESLL